MENKALENLTRMTDVPQQKLDVHCHTLIC